MIRAAVLMVLMGVFYAAFGLLWRNKSCSGHCGGCSGTCELTGEKYDDEI